MRSADSIKFANISATTAGFQLQGGQYLLDIVATFGGGSVSLQRLGPDSATWLSLGTAITSNGSQLYSCPPGTYRVQVTTATAVYAQLTRTQTE